MTLKGKLDTGMVTTSVIPRFDFVEDVVAPNLPMSLEICNEAIVVGRRWWWQWTLLW